jgi:hypothetical protein
VSEGETYAHYRSNASVSCTGLRRSADATEPAPGSKSETITAAKDARAAAEGTLSAELTSLRTLSPMLAPSTKPLVGDDRCAQADDKLMGSRSVISMSAAFDTCQQRRLDDLKGVQRGRSPKTPTKRH